MIYNFVSISLNQRGTRPSTWKTESLVFGGNSSRTSWKITKQVSSNQPTAKVSIVCRLIWEYVSASELFDIHRGSPGLPRCTRTRTHILQYISNHILGLPESVYNILRASWFPKYLFMDPNEQNDLQWLQIGE